MHLVACPQVWVLSVNAHRGDQIKQKGAKKAPRLAAAQIEKKKKLF